MGPTSSTETLRSAPHAIDRPNNLVTSSANFSVDPKATPAKPRHEPSRAHAVQRCILRAGSLGSAEMGA